MIIVDNLSVAFGKRILFKDVSLKFTPENCYGLIGANGSGKSTFLKVLSGEIEPSRGSIIMDPNKRMACLRQDHFGFDEQTVMSTVIMGHKKLFDLIVEKDILEAKADLTDDEGMRMSEIYGELADLDGYEAESEAAGILAGLGIQTELHETLMKNLEGGEKVRVLLAQAIFGNPDILLLDEPTNNLDLESITWLENFLADFKNTVIVVSHDRHFLNQVCTHISDIDYGAIRTYVGNYDFWYEAAQLGQEQRKDENRRKEDKIKQLQSFIQRFSANASKARQATSRRKLIDKLQPEDMPLTTRRFPYVEFKPDRECGKQILTVTGISKTVDGEKLLDGFSMTVNKGDKIAFLGHSNNIKTVLFEILLGRMKPDEGSFEWGITIKPSYFPMDNTELFDTDLNLINWLRQYTPQNQEDNFIRSCLGRMLFSGEEALKSARVLSGGEKVRCMLSGMMLYGGNALVMDEPTNHLDLEAITSLNNGLIKYPEVLLFASHDHQFVSTIANRVIEFTPGGVIDVIMPFEDYLESEEIKARRDKMYHGHHSLKL